MPGTTLLASLVAGTTYAVYRAHQLAERWTPRGVSVLPILFVVATSISYIANGGTLTQPAPRGTAAVAPPQTAPPAPLPPVATKGIPDYALPRQGLDITYDFGPPGSPHPVPGPAQATSATFPVTARSAPPPPAAHAPPPPPPPPPRHSIVPPLPPLPRPPIPRVPVPSLLH